MFLSSSYSDDQRIVGTSGLVSGPGGCNNEGHLHGPTTTYLLGYSAGSSEGREPQLPRRLNLQDQLLPRSL